MNPFGKNIIRLEETDSTNLYAERLLKVREVPEGTIIVAAFQSAGKGQGDNTWESERGKNLLVSVILKPAFLSPADQFILSKALTLAVCDLLGSNGITPSVKWPNDIYSGEKKIAGLLIQHRVSGQTLEHTIAGIGINLNQEQFPVTLPGAVSYKMLKGTDLPAESALGGLAGMLDHRYGQLKQGLTGQIGKEYQDRVQGLGQWRHYETSEGAVEGKILGVDEFGRLILEYRDGRKELFSHGEIKLPPLHFNPTSDF